jgi:hypothetical protein
LCVTATQNGAVLGFGKSEGGYLPFLEISTTSAGKALRFKRHPPGACSCQNVPVFPCGL